MKTYERITYRPEGAKRSTTALYEIVADLGGFLLLRPVDSDGGDRSFYDADGTLVDVQHLIESSLIRKRTAMTMNLHYGELEPTKEKADG